VASRPVFLPTESLDPLVEVRSFDFDWNSGFAPVQKKKNVVGLHRAARQAGVSPLLEVSTKSEHGLGQAFSAFRLRLVVPGTEDVLLECAYQGSKVFERGGPFRDLFSKSPKEARRDSRLKASGRLLCFDFEGFRWPLNPTFAFYDWLFIRSVIDSHLDPELLDEYVGFTDIEFNPKRSVNTQAHAAALIVSLHRRNELWSVYQSPEGFLTRLGAQQRTNEGPAVQSDLFDDGE
jgi:Family of unknown function (DUF6977)